ncbi:MAG: hypothetical protein J7L37_04295 [Thermococcus sp.]|nr:hypothetical protein [Thermococcus sp.]
MRKYLPAVFLIVILLLSTVPPSVGSLFEDTASAETENFLASKYYGSMLTQGAYARGVFDSVLEGNISRNEGDILWKIIFNDSSHEDYRLADLAETPSGDIIAVGTIMTSDPYSHYIWIFCLDKEGNVKWERKYDVEWNGAEAVAVAPNGDIIAVSIVSGEYHDSGANILLLRLDKAGNIKWQKTYDGSDYEAAVAVAIAPNGDIIMVGGTPLADSANGDFWVLRVDESGNVKWRKTYGGNNTDWATAVAISPNGDIIVAGWTESFGTGGGDVWVLWLDEDGTVKWQKTYGGDGWDEATAVAVAPNGDIIVTGSFTMRLDANGNVIWAKNVPGKAVVLAKNGDIIVTGSTWGSSAGSGDFWVLGLDESGELEWRGDYGEYGTPVSAVVVGGRLIVAGFSWIMGISYDSEEPGLKQVSTWGNDVAVTPEGDIIVVGWIEKETTNGKDMWILSLSPDGSENWERTFGFEGDETATAVVTSPDGGIFVTGNFTIRLDEHGNLVWISSQRGVDISLSGEGNLIVLSPSYQQFENNKMSSRFEIVKMDSSGRVLWKREFFDEKNAIRVSKMAVTPDGDIVVVGSSAANIGYSSSVVVCFDQNGNLKWRLTHGGKGFFNGDSAVAFSRALGIVTGGTTFYSVIGGGVKTDIVLSVINTSGILSWFGEYENGGVNRDNAVSDILVLPSGDVLILGYTCEDTLSLMPTDNVTSWVWVMDENKKIFWKRDFPGFAVKASALLPNGDLIVVGNKKQFMGGDEWYEAVILRIGLGNIPVPITQKVRFRGVVAGVDACTPITPYCPGGDWIINVTEIMSNFTWESSQIFVHLNYSYYNPNVWVDNVSEGDLVEVQGNLVMTPWPHVELVDKGDYLKRISKVNVSDADLIVITPVYEKRVGTIPSSEGEVRFEIWAKSPTGGRVYGYIFILTPDNKVREIPINMTLNKGTPTTKWVSWPISNDTLPGSYVAILHLYSDPQHEEHLIAAPAAFYIDDPDKSFVHIMAGQGIASKPTKLVHIHLQKLSNNAIAVDYNDIIEIFELEKIPIAKAILEGHSHTGLAGLLSLNKTIRLDEPLDVTFLTYFNASDIGGKYWGKAYETHPLDVVRKIFEDAAVDWLVDAAIALISGVALPATILKLLLAYKVLDDMDSIMKKLSFVPIPASIYDEVPEYDAYSIIKPTRARLFTGYTVNVVGITPRYQLRIRFINQSEGKLLTNAHLKLLFKEGVLWKEPGYVEIRGPEMDGSYYVEITPPVGSYSSDYTLVIAGWGKGWYGEKTILLSRPSARLAVSIQGGGRSVFGLRWREIYIR